MRNVDLALSALRNMAGLDNLDLDMNGQAELVFDGRIIVGIAKRGEEAFELTSPLAWLGTNHSAQQLTRLLSANYLGEATGNARIALDPRDSSVLLCERVEVLPLAEQDLEKKILDFVKHAAFWNSQEANDLVAGVPDEGSTRLAFDSSDITIRA